MPVSKEGLGQLCRIKTRDVAIDGVEVRMRMIDCNDRADIAAESIFGDQILARAGLLSRCLIDESGALMFPPVADPDGKGRPTTSPEAVEFIRTAASDVIEKLFEDALDFNGFRAERVEEVAKN